MIDFHRDAVSDDVVFSHQTYYYGNLRGRVEDEADEDEPGTDTPPLWRSSPPPSPPPRPEVTNYRCLSPASKAQAIARGQKDLMEMVSRMPESCYELSLRDLVEQPPPAAAGSNQKRTDEESFRKEAKRRSEERKIRSNRSGRYGNHNGGLFLKTVIPVYVGVNRSNKKKNQYDLGENSGSAAGNSRVSPKPPQVTAAKTVEKDWWSVGSSNRSGSTKSSGSSSRNSNSSRHQQRWGCWSFLRGRKSKRS